MMFNRIKTIKSYLLYQYVDKKLNCCTRQKQSFAKKNTNLEFTGFVLFMLGAEGGT